jgi:hypothetical protein
MSALIDAVQVKERPSVPGGVAMKAGPRLGRGGITLGSWPTTHHTTAPIAAKNSSDNIATPGSAFTNVQYQRHYDAAPTRSAVRKRAITRWRAALKPSHFCVTSAIEVTTKVGQCQGKWDPTPAAPSGNDTCHIAVLALETVEC